MDSDDEAGLVAIIIARFTGNIKLRKRKRRNGLNIGFSGDNLFQRHSAS